jgi:transposase
MPQQRQILQESDKNVRRGPNLSTEERGRIMGMLAGGCTVVEVARAYGRSDRCIRDLRTKYHQTGTTADKPRSGRPPVLSPHQKTIIYRKTRAAPNIEYSELAKEGVFVNPDGTSSKPPSRSTLYRVLKGRGLTKAAMQKRSVTSTERKA